MWTQNNSFGVVAMHTQAAQYYSNHKLPIAQKHTRLQQVLDTIKLWGVVMAAITSVYIKVKRKL